MIKKISVLAGLTLLVGCSAFKPASIPFSVVCSEPGAYVTVNGDTVTPPASVVVRRDHVVVVQATKPGFHPYAKTVKWHFADSGKLDVAGTVLWFFPCFGLLTAGAWDLDQTNIVINLHPQ